MFAIIFVDFLSFFRNQNFQPGAIQKNFLSFFELCYDCYDPMLISKGVKNWGYSRIFNIQLSLVAELVAVVGLSGRSPVQTRPRHVVI